MNVLASAPKSTPVNQKRFSCPVTLNGKQNASVSLALFQLVEKRFLCPGVEYLLHPRSYQYIQEILYKVSCYCRTFSYVRESKCLWSTHGAEHYPGHANNS